MKVAMWSTDNNAQFMPLFLYTLKKGGIPYEISENQKWVPGHAWEVRMRWYHEWLRKQRKNELVMLLDPWDQVFLGDYNAMMDIVETFRNPIVWSAEHICWPNSERSSEFPSYGTPYKFPNGGAIFGPAYDLAFLFNPDRIKGFGQPNYDSKKVQHPDGNQPWIDQVFFQDLYLDGYGELDYKCKLFQTLVGHTNADFRREGDRIKNVHTGECPLFFHANGRARFPDSLVRLLEEKL